MAISRSNLRFYLSGGPDNTDPRMSLGGAPSKTSIGRGLDDLFDDVTGLEAEKGRTDYRCIYFMNTDPNDEGLIDPFVWVVEPPMQSGFGLGLDRAGKNGIADLITDETTAPGGVSFSSPSSFMEALSLPDGPYLEGESIPIWVRRITPKGSRPATETVLIRVRGETY